MLGVADSEVDVARENAREVFALLRVGAERHDRGSDRVDRHEGERRAGALDLVEEDELLEHAASLAPVLAGPADAEPAVGADLPHDIAEHRRPLTRFADLLAHLGRQQPLEVVAQLAPQLLLLGRLVQKHRTRFSLLTGPDQRFGARRARQAPSGSVVQYAHRPFVGCAPSARSTPSANSTSCVAEVSRGKS